MKGKCLEVEKSIARIDAIADLQAIRSQVQNGDAETQRTLVADLLGRSAEMVAEIQAEIDEDH